MRKRDLITGMTIITHKKSTNFKDKREDPKDSNEIEEFEDIDKIIEELKNFEEEKEDLENIPNLSLTELEKKLRKHLSLEILHNIFFIRDDDYYRKLSENAERFDRDYQLWLKLSKNRKNLN